VIWNLCGVVKSFDLVLRPFAPLTHDTPQVYGALCGFMADLSSLPDCLVASMNRGGHISWK
jgi:hypothetical protein